MLNQLKVIEELEQSEQLSLITASKGVSGSVAHQDNVLVMSLGFKAQYKYTAGKTTIKAVDMFVSEAHFIDRTAYSFKELSADEDNYLPVPYALGTNHVEVISDVFSNSVEQTSVLDKYNELHSRKEKAISCKSLNSEIKIENETLNIKYFSYQKNVEGNSLYSLE